jgi:hypothetical protein
MTFDPYTKLVVHLGFHKDLKHTRRVEVNFHLDYAKNVLVNSVYLYTECVFPVLFIMIIA